MTQQRILFVTLSNIGDAVMTTPVLLALHGLHPRATVDIVADRRSAAIFEHCPFHGNIFYKDKRSLLRGIGPLLGELRASDYDLIVDLRTDFLPLLLRGRRRLCKWNGSAYGPHSVERHMGVISALHGRKPIPPAAIWLSAPDEAFAETVLRPAAGARILALGPGANWPPKIWPAENFTAVVAGLKGAGYGAVALLGDERDAAHAARIDTGPLLRIELCGRSSLLQAAAVLRRCALFIGNDSGLGHLAAAAGTPSLTLFGPGDPLRYRPWGPRAKWIAGPGQDLSRLRPDSVLGLLREKIRP